MKGGNIKKYFKKLIKKASGEAGFSLVEIMIAVLLISVVVTSVFSLALTSKVNEIRVNRRSVALYAMQQAREKIKAYVTADFNASGPNPAWKLPEDDCGPTAQHPYGNCSPGCKVFQEGCQHNVTRLLPPKVRDDNYIKMRLLYTVSYDASDTKKERPKVVFNVVWDN